MDSNNIVEQIIQRRRGQENLVTQIENANSELPSVNIIGLCETYDDEGYEEMEEDFPRNRAYCRAIAELQDKKNWLEIGCGSHALFSRIALRMHPKSRVTAFEVNQNSAKECLKIVKSKRFTLIPECSLESDKIRKEYSLKPNSFDVIIHEIFGFIASSEGCGVTMNHAIKTYKKKGENSVCLPGKAASFFTLTHLSPEDLDSHEVVYLTKKIILTHELEIPKYMLTDKSSCFEFFDFNPKTVNSKNECLELKQEKLHTFHILEEGILNTLSCFIFLDLSISEKQISKDDDEEDDDYLLFPYGDESLSHVRPSRYIDTLVYPYSRRCAENWMNLAIVLPQPVSVSPGDTVYVTTNVSVDSLTPSYQFSIIYRSKEYDFQTKDGLGTSVGKVELSFSDLYPDFITC